jgi:hypothetical protein
MVTANRFWSQIFGVAFSNKRWLLLHVIRTCYWSLGKFSRNCWISIKLTCL